MNKNKYLFFCKYIDKLYKMPFKTKIMSTICKNLTRDF